MTPRSMAIARRLIFWYLLTLQKSVMQTVKSANAPYRTTAAKCSLFNRVTISNAELVIRSAGARSGTYRRMNEPDIPVKTLEAAEKTPNIVRQPERMFWTRAWIICSRHCSTCKGVNQALSLINVSSKFTISRISGFALCVMVYSKGLKKSFWNLKCGNSSFSRKRIASCRKESRAKNPTWGLLWQQTCDSVGTKDKHSNSG